MLQPLSGFCGYQAVNNLPSMPIIFVKSNASRRVRKKKKLYKSRERAELGSRLQTVGWPVEMEGAFCLGMRHTRSEITWKILTSLFVVDICHDDIS